MNWPLRSERRVGYFKEEKMTTPARPPEAGFVLAGGQSSRMGRDKALELFGGRSLIEIALETLRQAGVDAAIAGARSELSGFAPVVEDREPDQGPLAGICAALSATSAERVAFVSGPAAPPACFPGCIHGPACPNYRPGHNARLRERVRADLSRRFGPSSPAFPQAETPLGPARLPCGFSSGCRGSESTRLRTASRSPGAVRPGRPSRCLAFRLVVPQRQLSGRTGAGGVNLDGIEVLAGWWRPRLDRVIWTYRYG